MQRSISQYLTVFIIGILLGITLEYVYSDHTQPTKTVVTHPDHLRHQMAAMNTAYQLQLDSLDKANSVLRKKIVTTQTALVQVKRQNSELHQTVAELLSLYDATTDTTMRLEQCDSLAVVVHELIELDSTKELLHEIITTDYQRAIQLRDSIIHIQHTQYDSLRVALVNTLEEQQALVKENDMQRKEIKRQKKRKGFLSTILVAVGGLFAYHSLR